MGPFPVTNEKWGMQIAVGILMTLILESTVGICSLEQLDDLGEHFQMCIMHQLKEWRKLQQWQGFKEDVYHRVPYVWAVV